MRKTITLILSYCLFASSLFGDAFESYAEETSRIMSTEDKEIASSMIGWGIGLFAAIAIIAGVLHQSKATTSSSVPDTPLTQ